ncbi:PHP domain-containing protein [Vitiosangium sp. GDMCC 1.1324]|uniref:PHP domain-containing protein n=1 Tax=Vitiosangium sp. (strain GDMCC 1.1324) TaxID=2138576 RepID=UPI000D396CC8|nr:PHP domain-containing protein [Vitiosangium sp. GDMCC 1.1324]PTL82346.1 phosphotransferase [Vitiosangium sp. GDMCC 1.1324]
MKPSVLAGKLLRALLGLVLVLLGWAGFFTLAASYAEYPVVPPQPDAPRWLRGAFHVHTTRSDGRGTVEEVAAAAKAAGLRFVVLTDHNDFVPPEPAFVDGVLMVPGVELSTAHGHLVAFGMQRPLEGVRPWMDGGEAEAAVEKAGGVSVLAHPVQQRNPWRHEEAARRADGFELYSADTFFRDALRHPFSRLLPAVGALFGNPVHGVMMLVEPGPEPVARLLELEREKPRVALCSHDAHGLPRYEDVFRSMAMYLPDSGELPGDARAAAAQVVKGLASGRALCAFQALGEPEGFALEGLDAERREAHVGDVLTVRLPPHAEDQVRVEVRGAGRLRPDGRTVELVEEGAVQVEAWVRAPGGFFGTQWRPWIAPSPVRVLPRR